MKVWVISIFILFSSATWAAGAVPERTDFIETVKSFLKKKKLTLPELFQFERKDHGQTPDRNSRYRREFFAIPKVRDYLSRPSTQLNFQDFFPDLRYQVMDKDHSDFYELEIYRLAQGAIPYRQHLWDQEKRQEYYLSGTPDTTCSVMAEPDKSLEERGIRIAPAADVYQARHYLNRLKFPDYFPASESRTRKNSTSPQFILFPSSKDGHAFVILAFFDPETRRTLTGVLINSVHDPEYLGFIESRWNMRQYYRYELEAKNLKRSAYKKAVAEAIQGLERTSSSDHSGDFVDLYRDKPWLNINEQIPLLDASVNLQLTEEDLNCRIYGFSILNALKKTLSDTRVANRLAQLAREDREALPKFLVQLLKKNLPQYYLADGDARPPADLKAHHLTERWEIGNKMLQSIGALEEAGLFRGPTRED